MAKFDDNGFIVELDENEVIVYGSNGIGSNGSGLARFAEDMRWTDNGLVTGLSNSGKAFAVNTMSGLREFHDGLAKLFLHANLNPQKTFYLTAIGTGIAGYSKSDLLYLIEQSSKEVHHNIKSSNVKLSW